MRSLVLKPALSIGTALGMSLALISGMHSVSYAADDTGNEARISQEDQIHEILSEAVREIRVGRYEEAQRRFQSALDMDPENKLIYDFYLRVGPEALLNWRERAELKDVIDDILGRERIYKRELLRSPIYINDLIDLLVKSEEQRIIATQELVAAGPRAVPHLVKRLADNREDNMRVYCRVVLTRMGYRAVVPLLEATNAQDERLVTTLLAVLADIGDARALPRAQQLQEIHESETLRRVAGNTVAAIARASRIETINPTPVLFFSEALRYFRDLGDIQDEVVANESLMWAWNDDSQDLSFVRSPRYAWNELMAEEILFDATAAYKEYPGYLALTASVLAAQDVEVDLRLRLAKENITPAAFPEEELASLEERQQALSEISDRIIMNGVENLCQSIKQAIVSERYNVATYLMRLLEDEYITWPELHLPTTDEGLAGGKVATTLVAAMDHGERSVRYQAAITLAHLDPKLQFFGSEKVMNLLAEAISEWGMKVILVVEPDYRHRNAARRELLSRGYLVVTAANGFEATQRLLEAPIKDAVIIAGDLVPVVRDEHGEVIDVPEQTAPTLIELIRTKDRIGQVPVFASLPEDPDLSLEIEDALDGKVSAFVNKPYAASELAGAIDEALKDSVLPDLNRDKREDVSLRAAQALASVDPVFTQYGYQEERVTNALLETLIARNDGIRISALHALGHFGASAFIDRVTDIYNDQHREFTPELKAAFLYCIGLLDPDTPSAKVIIGEALKSEHRIVRGEAARAAAHARSLTLQDRYGYEVQQRLNDRTSGAGTE